jgi:hypothetical protein
MATIQIDGAVSEDWLKVTYWEHGSALGKEGYALTQDVVERYGFTHYDNPVKAMLETSFPDYPLERIKTSFVGMGRPGKLDNGKDQVRGYGEVW